MVVPDDKPRSEKDALPLTLATDGIEAKALARIIQDAHLAFKEIAISKSLEEQELTIYPFKQGSFKFWMELLATGTVVFGVFREILALKRAKLELDKSKNDSSKEKSPQSIAVNPIINIHINDFLKVISENTNGLTIGEGKSSFKFTSEEIKTVLGIEKAEELKEKFDRRTIEKRDQQLSLVKISDKKFGMWEFIYDENRVKVEIPSNLKKSARFRKYSSGMKFTVSLKIRQEYNAKGQAWENIAYRITAITKIDPMPPF